MVFEIYVLGSLAAGCEAESIMSVIMFVNLFSDWNQETFFEITIFEPSCRNYLKLNSLVWHKPSIAEIPSDCVPSLAWFLYVSHSVI